MCLKSMWCKIQKNLFWEILIWVKFAKFLDPGILFEKEGFENLVARCFFIFIIVIALLKSVDLISHIVGNDIWIILEIEIILIFFAMIIIIIIIINGFWSIVSESSLDLAYIYLGLFLTCIDLCVDLDWIDLCSGFDDLYMLEVVGNFRLVEEFGLC